MAAPLARPSARMLLSCLSTRLRVCSACVKRFSVSVPQNHESANPRQTHFGFQSVPEEEKEHKVYEVFENVAGNYDLMNDVMSGGVHRLWKDHFMRRLSPTAGTKLIDVAGGTGDIAFRFLQYIESQSTGSQQNVKDFDIPLPREVEAQVYVDPAKSQYDESSSSSSSSSDEEESRGRGKEGGGQTHVTVLDINQAMLDVGKQRAEKQGLTSGISWVQGNAESLPFSDCSFDAYTIAFGIRNCTNVQQVVDEAYRVLKPGGRFMCLEFSQVTNPLLRSVYDTYSFNVIPVMGQVIARDWKSYQYLVESIRQFPDQEEFSDMIRSSGFRMVSYENLTFGVAAIHSGFRLHA
ncbi:LOW QUALITY PROTEIN: ubiquinone/menaquinone biosynthesis C-methyltransferase UbiE-like [Babylonia areolata]|uniref:LOW QUALITY PROTEIN: ubiquinone/menaquinone biosynthesis C-methyltransferase UbiE-like n=1 Tax=Babylonia areolata TaxID=304850 RepID=UPI003FD3B3B3